MDIPKNFQIGTYDEGIFDLEDKVNLAKKTTVDSKSEALNIAKNDQGTEFIVERKNQNGGLSYDVYDLTINDKDKKIHKLQDAENLKLFDNTLDIVEENTGTKGSVKGFLVAENGEVSKPVYKTQFERTTFDKIRQMVVDARESMGFEKNIPWFWLVDTVMGSDTPPDDLPPIERKEILNMKSHINPGDIILNGNDTTLIHGILYVGEDKDLQSQLEKKWGMEKGALNGEGIIIHSLVSDSDKEVEINGKKELLKAGGTGVIIDTIERYADRHSRDVMLAVSIKDATSQNRQEAINAAKQFIGKEYDRSFNTYDDKEMYCTETVMKAWLNTSNPPEFSTQRHPLISYPKFVLDRLPDKIAKAMEDGGMLHQEMIMVDGIASSKSTEVVWASQNADKSEFFNKHSRWSDGFNGKINEDYKEMIMRDVPNVASGSEKLTEKIKELSLRTRNEL